MKYAKRFQFQHDQSRIFVLSSLASNATFILFHSLKELRNVVSHHENFTNLIRRIQFHERSRPIFVIVGASSPDYAIYFQFSKGFPLLHTLNYLLHSIISSILSQITRLILNPSHCFAHYPPASA